MVCKAGVDSFQAECDRFTVERDYFEKFDEVIIEDHGLANSSDDSLDDSSFASTWHNLTAQDQENKSSSDDGHRLLI